jgi:hypothetical protein
MNTIKGATLSAALNTITADNIPVTLWEVLPESGAGPSWVGEVADSAMTLASWLNDDEEYNAEKLSDMTYQLADSEVEDYYSKINTRVQELSLWANSDLDSEVQELINREDITLTGLNSLYLYCAMRGLYYVLGEWAMDNAEELESVA